MVENSFHNEQFVTRFVVTIPEKNCTAAIWPLVATRWVKTWWKSVRGFDSNQLKVGPAFAASYIFPSGFSLANAFFRMCEQYILHTRISVSTVYAGFYAGGHCCPSINLT